MPRTDQCALPKKESLLVTMAELSFLGKLPIPRAASANVRKHSLRLKNTIQRRKGRKAQLNSFTLPPKRSPLKFFYGFHPRPPGKKRKKIYHVFSCPPPSPKERESFYLSNERKKKGRKLTLSLHLSKYRTKTRGLSAYKKASIPLAILRSLGTHAARTWAETEGRGKRTRTRGAVIYRRGRRVAPTIFPLVGPRENRRLPCPTLLRLSRRGEGGATAVSSLGKEEEKRKDLPWGKKKGESDSDFRTIPTEGRESSHRSKRWAASPNGSD